MKTYNLEQFAQEIIKNNGATYHLPTGRMKFNDGYFVALLGYDAVHDDLSNVRGAIASFITDNGFTLSNEDNYLGAWVEKGKLVLDVVVKIDDKKEALAFGYRNKQEAIFDNNRGLSIYL
jgi:hypothetical protein